MAVSFEIFTVLVLTFNQLDGRLCIPTFVERIIVRYLSLQEQVLEEIIVVPWLFHSTNGVCRRHAAHTLYFNQLGRRINKIC